MQVSGRQPQFCFFSQADAVLSGRNEDITQLDVGRTVQVNARLAPPHLRQGKAIKLCTYQRTFLGLWYMNVNSLSFLMFCIFMIKNGFIKEVQAMPPFRPSSFLITDYLWIRMPIRNYLF